jgi:NAD-dependent SIR2 family protein deacetylase
MSFLRNPANHAQIGGRFVPTKIPGFLNLPGTQDKDLYKKLMSFGLNAMIDIEAEAKAAGVKMTQAKLVDAATIRAKSSTFALLASIHDPALDDEPEGPEPESELGPVYTPVNEIPKGDIADHFTFLLGAGVSKDSGIETFVGMSPEAGEELGRRLVEAWMMCPDYSPEEVKKHKEDVHWPGDIKDYFLNQELPGDMLRNALSTMAATYYRPIMLAAWEFMYKGIAQKRPSLIHNILRALDETNAPDNESMLGYVVTMNVDGLEFAAELDPTGIMMAHGSVFLKQPTGTGIGEAQGTLINSLSEIRSGQFRPAIVFYGEEVLPSVEDMTSVIDMVDDQTLVVAGTSLGTGSGLLTGMTPKTTIVVNSDPKTAAMIVDMLERSTRRTKGAAHVKGIGDKGPVVAEFSSENVYAIRNAEELRELINRVFEDVQYRRSDSFNTDPPVLSSIEARFNEFVHS